VKNLKTEEERELSVDGLFVSIGRKPVTELFGNAFALDEAGYIVADETTKTNIPGVYAVGDVRTKVLRQVITAASDGAVAAHFAEEYLSFK
jgi:thioredoxin reductase (NADPH)